MNLDSTDLNTLKRVITRSEETTDPFAKESLRQYMEDLSRKYNVSWLYWKINMDTGELVKIGE